jgi:hypothetical protein
MWWNIPVSGEWFSDRLFGILLGVAGVISLEIRWGKRRDI